MSQNKHPLKVSSPISEIKETVYVSEELGQKGSSVAKLRVNSCSKKSLKKVTSSDTPSTYDSELKSLKETKSTSPSDTAKRNLTGEKSESQAKFSNSPSVSSAAKCRRAASKTSQSSASQTANGFSKPKATKSSKPSSPPPHMRIGSPFKKSVAGKVNPKPFGMGRSEFHAFTYQGQVGGSNRKVVKSKSFVCEQEPEKPPKSSHSKPRRNSLPSKLNANEKPTGNYKLKLKNKYSHVSSKTDSGIRRSASGTLNGDLSKNESIKIDKSELSSGNKAKSEMKACQNLTTPETEDKNQEEILDTLNAEADMEVEKIDSMTIPQLHHESEKDHDLNFDSQMVKNEINDSKGTEKRIAMGVLRVCSPDVPIFYASHDKGKTSPTFSDFEHREAVVSPGVVVDEEDVSICETPDITQDEVSKRINQCWSLKCDHVSDKVIEPEVVECQSKDAVVSPLKCREFLVVESYSSPAHGSPIKQEQTDDVEIHVTGSKGSPTSETAESSIFVDSMLTTIYSGEEYTRNECVSKNLILSRTPGNDLPNADCRASESSSPSFLSATLEDVSQSNEQNEVKNSPVQGGRINSELERDEEGPYDGAEQICHDIDMASPKPDIKSSLSENLDSDQLELTKTFDEMLTQYQQEYEIKDSCSIDEAVRKLDTMVEDNSEQSMSIDEYLRAFTPLYDTMDQYSPTKSSPLTRSRKSSPVSDPYRGRRAKSGTRSKSVSPTSSMGSGRRRRTENRIPRRNNLYLGSCRSTSSCTFNDTALDEEIRKIETKCSSGSESENEPLSETLGRVEYVLDEITKMGTRKISKSMSRQSGKSSLSSSPFLNYKWEERVAPSKFVEDSLRDLETENSIDAKAGDFHGKDKTVTANQIDMSRILSKIDQVKDDVRREKAVLKTTIRQTHDLLGFQSQVSHMQISSTPDVQDTELDVWRRESFELLREHEAALQKILKYERKLDKLRAFMKTIARKRSAIETRIQSRMSVNTGTPRGTPCGTPRTGTPVKSIHAISRKCNINLSSSTSRLPGAVNVNPGDNETHFARQNGFRCATTNGHSVSNPRRSNDEHAVKKLHNEADLEMGQRSEGAVTKSTSGYSLDNPYKSIQQPRTVPYLKKQLQQCTLGQDIPASPTTTTSSKILPQISPSVIDNSTKSNDFIPVQRQQKNASRSLTSMLTKPNKKGSVSPSHLSGIPIRSEASKLVNTHEQNNVTITRSRDLIMQLPKYEGQVLNSPNFKTSKNLNSLAAGKGSFQQKVTFVESKQESRVNPYENVTEVSREHWSSSIDKRRNLTNHNTKTQLPIENPSSRNRHESNGSTSSAITISSSSSGVTLDETKSRKIDRSCIVDKYLSSESLSYTQQDEQVVHGVIIGDKVLVRGRKNNETLHEDFMIEARQFHDRMY